MGYLWDDALNLESKGGGLYIATIQSGGKWTNVNKSGKFFENRARPIMF